jgi:hypothetical protein
MQAGQSAIRIPTADRSICGAALWNCIPVRHPDAAVHDQAPPFHDLLNLVCVRALIAVGVNGDGPREVQGLEGR